MHLCIQNSAWSEREFSKTFKLLRGRVLLKALLSEMSHFSPHTTGITNR